MPRKTKMVIGLLAIAALVAVSYVSSMEVPSAQASDGMAAGACGPAAGGCGHGSAAPEARECPMAAEGCCKHGEKCDRGEGCEHKEKCRDCDHRNSCPVAASGCQHGEKKDAACGDCPVAAAAAGEEGKKTAHGCGAGAGEGGCPMRKDKAVAAEGGCPMMAGKLQAAGAVDVAPKQRGGRLKSLAEAFRVRAR